MVDMHLSSPDENKGNEFIDKAIRLVKEEIDLPDDTMGGLVIYVVWFVKTLQNWKALLSSNIPDGRYYEVTYNGDKAEAYVDTYIKTRNTRRPDTEPGKAQYSVTQEPPKPHEDEYRLPDSYRRPIRDNPQA